MSTTTPAPPAGTPTGPSGPSSPSDSPSPPPTGGSSQSTTTTGSSSSSSTSQSTTSNSSGSTSQDSKSTSSTSSSSSSSTTSHTTSATTAAPVPAASTTGNGVSVLSITSTAPGGQVFTSTVTAPAPTLSATGSRAQDNGSTPFFKNKGAVAGVFTVAGIVFVIFVIALATNAVRRRRARKFDEDVAAAAADAAKAPRYPFDEFDDNPTGYPGGAYSDPESHGTYAQPPLTYEGYNMNEFARHPASTAAGIGANANVRHRRRDSAGTDMTAGIAGFGSNTAAVMRTGPTPMAYGGAFVGPPPPAPQSDIRYGDVGSGNMAGAYLTRGPSDPNSYGPKNGRRSSNQAQQQPPVSYSTHYQPDYPPSQLNYPSDPNYANGYPTPAPHGIANNVSHGGSASETSTLPNPYPSSLLTGYQPPSSQQPVPIRNGSPSAEFGDEDAYATEAYVVSSSPPQQHQSPFHNEESRMSFRDDEDYALDSNRRVLKVANE